MAIDVATEELIHPDWPAPARVRGFVTTCALGDMRPPQGSMRLRAQLPAEPAWLKQVHGIRVVDAACGHGTEADASFTRDRNVACVITIADCMPVFLAHDEGEVVAIAHAGWRGLAAGVIEATIEIGRAHV